MSPLLVISCPQPFTFADAQAVSVSPCPQHPRSCQVWQTQVSNTFPFLGSQRCDDTLDSVPWERRSLIFLLLLQISGGMEFARHFKLSLLPLLRLMTLRIPHLRKNTQLSVAHSKSPFLGKWATPSRKPRRLVPHQPCEDQSSPASSARYSHLFLIQSFILQWGHN